MTVTAPETWVWCDGSIRPPEEARISIWDHGLLYGDGIFEGLRLHEGRLFRPTDHLARLRRSARMLALDVPYDDEQLLVAVGQVASANRLTSAHVRIIVTRGAGAPGLDPRRSAGPSAWVLGSDMPPLLGGKPLTLLTSHVVRKSPRSVPPGAKTLNYLDAVLAKLQAIAAGADDALMLDGQGLVAEATAANVFCVIDGCLVTPTCSAALPGITRRTVLELAAELDVEVEQRGLTLGELHTSDEAFVTGTAAGIVPVGVIDGRKLPRAPGPTTAAVTRRYAELRSDPRYTLALAATSGSGQP